MRHLLPQLVNLQLNARADSTVRKYRASWLKWRSWATSKLAVPVIPAQAIHVALFITELERTAKERNLGFSSIEGVVYGISWYHKLAGLSESPTDHPVVKMAVEGAKRSLAKPIKPKEALFLRLIQDIACHYHSTDTLAVVRFLFIVLVGYAGFLRADELLNLQVSDITIFYAYMSIHVPERKNDKYRQGHTVSIARSGKVTCPVSITEKLLNLLPPGSNKQLPILRRIVSSKSKQRFHEHKGVSYSTIKDEFRKYLVVNSFDARAPWFNSGLRRWM